MVAQQKEVRDVSAGPDDAVRWLVEVSGMDPDRAKEALRRQRRMTKKEKNDGDDEG